MNGCPNHPYKVLNPTTPYGTPTTFNVPLLPSITSAALTSTTGSKDLSAQGGGVGVLFNGALVFSAYGGPQYGQTTSYTNTAAYAEGYSFDQCGCHASTSNSVSYHCHVPPSCLLQQLGQTDTAHSPQIGWMADGFPLYGPRGKDGRLLQSCAVAGLTYGTDTCVDSCNGHGAATGGGPCWVNDGFTYRYYLLGFYDNGLGCTAPTSYGSSSALYYPMTPLCLRGCGSTTFQNQALISSCSGTTTSGTTTTTGAKTGLPVNANACAYASLTTGTASPSGKVSTVG